MTCNIPIREFKFIYAVLKFVYNISSNASNRSCCLAIIKLYSYKINQVFVNCLNYLARNFRIKGYEGHFSKGLMDGPGLMYYEKSGVLLFRGTFRSALLRASFPVVISANVIFVVVLLQLSVS